MTTLHYQVAGLSLTGTSKPGRQQVAITASQIQLAPPALLTHASVQVSFDGGKTWHPATVSKLSPGHFRTKFTTPAGAKVTLRTRVSGTAGTSVTETIWDAYRVANRRTRFSETPRWIRSARTRFSETAPPGASHRIWSATGQPVGAGPVSLRRDTPVLSHRIWSSLN